MQSPLRPPDDDEIDDRIAGERVNQRSRPIIGYFALFLAASYVLMGVALLLVPAQGLKMPTTWRIGLSVILILYGVLRVWRTYNRYYR